MESGLPTAHLLEIQQLTVWKTKASPVGHAPDDGKAPPAETTQAAALAAPAETPAKLRVEIDPQSGRYVQMLVDPHTQEVLAMYPTQTQLAFSRGISAYLRARRGE